MLVNGLLGVEEQKVVRLTWLLVSPVCYQLSFNRKPSHTHTHTYTRRDQQWKHEPISHHQIHQSHV
jgi:hypothetical protein